jgi:hypothetical protein
VLGWLNRLHIRITGAEVDEYRPGWTRFARRAGRQPARRGARPRDDRSVAVAALVFAVWFFGFAGSSLPGG